MAWYSTRPGPTYWKRISGIADFGFRIAVWAELAIDGPLEAPFEAGEFATESADATARICAAGLASSVPANQKRGARLFQTSSVSAGVSPNCIVGICSPS